VAPTEPGADALAFLRTEYRRWKSFHFLQKLRQELQLALPCAEAQGVKVAQAAPCAVGAASP
jgi:hypothetical protein